MASWFVSEQSQTNHGECRTDNPSYSRNRDFLLDQIWCTIAVTNSALYVATKIFLVLEMVKAGKPHTAERVLLYSVNLSFVLL